MFNDSKYTKWYETIVQRAQKELRRKKNGYYEAHHIIPESLGGPNTKANLVLLTAKEHYICHLLLVKMLEGQARFKMVYAFFRMKDKHTAGSYHQFKTAYGRLIRGPGNAFFGKKHTEETRAKMTGEGHPLFGKHHRNETKQKMSQTKRGMFKGPLNPMYGIERGYDRRKQQSDRIAGRRALIKDGIIKRVRATEIESFLANGWQYKPRVREKKKPIKNY